MLRDNTVNGQYYSDLLIKLKKAMTVNNGYQTSISPDLVPQVLCPFLSLKRLVKINHFGSKENFTLACDKWITVVRKKM